MRREPFNDWESVDFTTMIVLPSSLAFIQHNHMKKWTNNEMACNVLPFRLKNPHLSRATGGLGILMQVRPSGCYKTSI